MQFEKLIKRVDQRDVRSKGIHECFALISHFGLQDIFGKFLIN